MAFVCVLWTSLVLLCGCDRSSTKQEVEDPAVATDEAAIDYLSRARQCVRDGRFDEAAGEIRKALLQHPDDATIVLLASEIEAARGHPQLAVDLASRVDPRA